MKDRLTIGSSPWGEDCAQVGTHNYGIRANAECHEFIEQLRRVAAVKGKSLDGLALVTTPFPHDYGTYFEVTVGFDGEVRGQVEAAYWLEAHIPELWDDIARTNLGIDPW